MKFIQAKNYNKSSGRDIKLIVIHDMEYPEKAGAALWCANFFAGSQAPKASAHYCVDNNEIIQCVKDEDVAWHAPGANRNGIGIEHAGYAKQTASDWMDDYSREMLVLSAGLVADLCDKYGIPVKRLTVEELAAGEKGIVGHADVSKWKGGGHWDPGPNFPWDWYLDQIVRSTANTMTPVPTIDSRGICKWQSVILGTEEWLVAPNYVGPISIGAAEALAHDVGCELPTPELVDAIWRQADLRIESEKMVRTDHDFTLATMSSSAIISKQLARMREHIAGRSYSLIAGTFKDVVQKEGVVGIYGWHHLDGEVIQPFYSKHAKGWIDYSQGLRLVRRA